MKRLSNTHHTTLLIALIFVSYSGAWAGEPFRRAIAAGPMYAAEPEALVASMDRLFAEADPPAPPPGRLVAVIAPHDPYGLSGRVAASAFKSLAPGRYDKVLVLGACHRNTMEGCSIASVAAYLTPLGPVPLAGKTVSRLCRSSLVSARGLRYKHNDFLRSDIRVPLHETEYSIEVLLPFLQRKLGRFSLIPILVGDLNQTYQDGGNLYGPSPNTDRGEAVLLAIADTIRPVIDDQTLLVVSSNLTHFGNDFSFRPFSSAGDIMGGIEALDTEAIQLLLARDRKGFDAYLERTGNPICGATSLRLLLELLPRGTRGQLLDYDNSANKLKAHRVDDEVTRSVSYAAISFYAPEAPPPGEGNTEPITLSQETLEAWEAGRAEREAAEAKRPKAFTLKLVGPHKGDDRPKEDVWVSGGPVDSTSPSKGAEQKAAEPDASPPPPTAGDSSVKYHLKGGKVTIQR